jgi:O-antigen ligase
VLWERVTLVRPITIALIPIALVVALASGSRGPLLVLVVLVALWGIRSLARPRTVDWRVAGVIAGVALASIVVLSFVARDLPTLSLRQFAGFTAFVQGGLAGDPGASGSDTSSATRVSLYGLAVSLFEGRPIVGVGTAGFEALSPRSLGPIDAGAYPHDAVLQFAAEYGIVGVTLFISLVLVALSRRLPQGRSAFALRALFLFYLLNAMVSGDIFSDRETWGLLLLLLLLDLRTNSVTRAEASTSVPSGATAVRTMEMATDTATRGV